MCKSTWQGAKVSKKYTVAIPVRDGAATVGEVLKAAAAQKPAPAKILVCDDGSLDDSACISCNSGAKVIFNERSCGVAGARNALFKTSKTEIIVFFDADAIPRPGCVAALLAPFADADVGAVGGRGVEVGDATFADRWRARHTPQSHGEERIDDNWMVMGLCCAFRREALDSIDGFSGRFACCGEDVDISVRLRQAGWRLVYEPRAIVDHARSDHVLGVLNQAFRHSREAARALTAHGLSTRQLEETTVRALLPAMTRDLKKLNAPGAVMSVANMTVRLGGLWVGKFL